MVKDGGVREWTEGAEVRRQERIRRGEFQSSCRGEFAGMGMVSVRCGFLFLIRSSIRSPALLTDQERGRGMVGHKG